MTDQLTTDLESLKISPQDRGVTHRTGFRFGHAIAWLLGLSVTSAVGLYAAPMVQARLFKTEVRVGEIMAVSPVQAQTALTATGYVVPQRLSRVASRIVGRVAQVRIREGQPVVEGEVLLQLDTADQQSAVIAARARVLAAQARVATAQMNFADVRQQVERQRPLVQSGAEPRSVLQDLEARAQSLNALITAAGAEVRSAQAEVEVLRVGVSQRTIVAPIAGTILDKPPEIGEMLSPERTVVEIADLHSLVVVVDVPEGRLKDVHVNSPCEIALDAFPNRRLRGATLEIGHRIDRAKATVPVKVRFVDPSDDVLPNMSARVGFLTAEISRESLGMPEKILVPAAAVTTRGGLNVVFTVDQGTVHPRRVRLGQTSGTETELLEGPQPGTKVVLNPAQTLENGQAVKEARD